jgi:arylsulfatase A-like enzyme
MVSGLPPHRTRCWDNGTNVSEELPSFMQRLGERDYQTHGVGKMHFTPRRERLWGFESRDVSERGDDDYRAFLDANGYDYVLDVHGALSEMYLVPQISQMPAHLHESAWVADCSIDFLRRRDTGRPFFLWSSFFSPHPPFNAPTPWNYIYWAGQMPPPFRPAGCEDLLTYWNHLQNQAKYRGQGYDVMLMRTIKAIYYASISFVDYQIGRILEALGDELENTLIVFGSDHGELLGDYGCLGKRSMLDASARVPLIVRWPGAQGAGTRCDEVASLLDVYPTLLAASGDACPQVCDEGYNLAEVARGETGRRCVYSQLQSDAVGLHMAVTKTRKYVYSAADQREWLFDLETDPSETHDVARNCYYDGDRAGLSAALRKRYQRDGYTSPLDGQEWKDFGGRKPPVHPDEGLLVQYPKNIRQILGGLGAYAPKDLPPGYWMGKPSA